VTSDANDIVLIDASLLDLDTVGERAVEAVEIPNLVPGCRVTAKLCVIPRNRQIIHYDIVIGCSTDPHERLRAVHLADLAEVANAQD
jgi:hypothetical protein